MQASESLSRHAEANGNPSELKSSPSNTEKLAHLDASSDALKCASPLPQWAIRALSPTDSSLGFFFLKEPNPETETRLNLMGAKMHLGFFVLE